MMLSDARTSCLSIMGLLASGEVEATDSVDPYMCLDTESISDQSWRRKKPPEVPATLSFLPIRPDAVRHHQLCFGYVLMV